MARTTGNARNSVFASVGLAAAFVVLRFPLLEFLPSEQPIPAMCLLGVSYAVFTAAIWCVGETACQILGGFICGISHAMIDVRKDNPPSKMPTVYI